MKIFENLCLVINVCEDVWIFKNTNIFWKLIKIWKFFLIERCFMNIYDTNIYESFILRNIWKFIFKIVVKIYTMFVWSCVKWKIL